MTDETRKQYARAYDLGRQARSAGKLQGANPFQGNTALARGMHEQWFFGWSDRAAELRGKR